MKSATISPNQDTTAKDRSGFLSVLQRHITTRKLDPSGSLLVLGASDGDGAILHEAGWSSITLSNFSSSTAMDETSPYLELDAEDINLPDESFESVAAYEVLHHCRSPHRALCEMLRVSRRYVFLQEPNDSGFYKLLRRVGLIFPFEIPAVVANGYVAGGVRNSCVPNFIYRWNHSTIYQTALTFHPERTVYVHSYPYWELNHTEYELQLRMNTPIGFLIRAAGGAGNLRRLLRLAQNVLNGIPLVRQQGNQFFCCIEKTDQLREWLVRDHDRVVFNRQCRPADNARTDFRAI
jgi:SAM-dependent methyltransferase